jgi:hypothetical protein
MIFFHFDDSFEVFLNIERNKIQFTEEDGISNGIKK